MNLGGGEADDTDHEVDEEMQTESDEEMALYAFLLTQYSLKARLRKFGEKANEEAMGELTQLHVMDMCIPQEPKKLSRTEKIKAPSSFICIKQKRDGWVKGRM